MWSIKNTPGSGVPKYAEGLVVPRAKFDFNTDNTVVFLDAEQHSYFLEIPADHN